MTIEPRPKRVYVVWEDCYEMDTDLWVEKPSEPFKWEPYLVEQIGFLLYDGPEGIVLTDSWTDREHIGTRVQIPRGMIRKLEFITTRKATRKEYRARTIKATGPGTEAVGDSETS